jgi:predicted transcriptional regulator
MKTFSELRELTGRKPEGQVVVNKKLGRIQVMVYKERNGFVAYIDGDRLDRYRTKQEAEKAATEFIKVIKK